MFKLKHFLFLVKSIINISFNLMASTHLKKAVMGPIKGLKSKWYQKETARGTLCNSLD